jgi:hypothetical protein
MRKVLSTLVLLASGSLAQAGPILTTFLEPGTGNIQRSGSSLVGTNLGAGSILSGPTPLNSHAITGLFNDVGAHGILRGDAHFNFATGSLLSDQTFGRIEVFKFAPGGSFSLIGGANLDHLAGFHSGDIAGGTTLLNGEFTGNTTLVYDRLTGLATLIGSTRDTLNPTLASYYGVTAPFGGVVDVSFLVTRDGVIHNLGGAAALQAVPEPGVLALLVSGGLFGGVSYLWRRRAG